MPKSTQVIAFPAKGVNRTLLRSTQPEGTAYDMLNVLPFDRDGRMRGAKRPGLAKLWASALSTGSNPIQHLGQTTIALDPSSVEAGTTLFNDDFNYTASSDLFTQANGTWASYQNFLSTEGTGAWSTTGTSIKATTTGPSFMREDSYTLGSAYVISASIKLVGSTVGKDYRAGFFARINKSAPSLTGVVACFVYYNGSGGLTLKITTGNPLAPTTTVASVDISTTYPTGPGTTITLELHVNGDVFQGYVDGTLYASGSTTSNSGNSGVGGFANTNAVTSSNTEFNSYTVSVGTALASYRQTNIVGVCGGNVYVGDLDTQATLAPGGGTVLRDTGLVAGAFSGGYYYLVDGLTIRKLNLATKAMVTYTATAGSAPSDVRLACMYRDRLVLADDQQNFYFSRVGTHTDWDYTQTDPAAAFAGNASVSGRIGEPIVALIPFSDDQLLIGGDHNLWCIRGDLADGGSIDLISDAIGVLGQNAWCKSPDGTVYFVGTGGLWKMEPGGVPVNISNQSWNDFFASINRATNYLTMAWDRDRQGMMIFVTPVNTGTATHLWFDGRTLGFFPQQFPDTVGPICSLVYDGDDKDDRVNLMGGRDGYVRALNDSRLHDDGVDITAYVELGPFPMGDGRNDGIISDVQLTYGELPSIIAAGSWGAKCEIRAGRDAHQVTEGTGYRSAVRDFGAMTGRVTGMVQKVRGAFGLLRIYENTTKHFAFETAVVTIETAGPTRR